MKAIPVTGGRVAANNSPPIGLVIPFMLLAVLHLAALQVWLALHPGILVSRILLGPPDLLVAIHLFTLGFGSLLIAAALHQLLPAVLDAPLRSLWVAAGELLLFILGADCLIIGFGSDSRQALHLGGLLLGVAVTALLVHLGLAMVRSKQFSLTGWYLAAAVLHLGLVATLGVILVHGVLHGRLGLNAGTLVLTHLTLGLGGWLGLAVVGASYRLVPMFTGSPVSTSTVAKPVLLTLALGLPTLAACVLLGAPPPLNSALAVLVVLALAAYGADLWHLIAVSRRPQEASGRFARAGIVALWAGLAAGVGAGIAAAALGTGQLALAGPGPLLVVRLMVIAFYLLTVGWIGTLALGQLHMILPFLVWLQLYKPLAGKVKIPTLSDLQRGGAMGAVLWLLGGSTTLIVGGVAVGWAPLVLFGGLLGTVAVLLALVGQLRMLALALYAFRTGTNPVGSSRTLDPRKEGGHS